MGSQSAPIGPPPSGKYFLQIKGLFLIRVGSHFCVLIYIVLDKLENLPWFDGPQTYICDAHPFGWNIGRVHRYLPSGLPCGGRKYILLVP